MDRRWMMRGGGGDGRIGRFGGDMFCAVDRNRCGLLLADNVSAAVTNDDDLMDMDDIIRTVEEDVTESISLRPL
eukprot:8425156-Ditylum_brightwellii.AAC.1